MRWLRQRPTYLRIFMAVSFVFLLLTVTVSLGITSLFSKYAYEEIDKFSSDKLQQTLENAEFVLRNLKDEALRMYEDAAIKGWLYAHEEEAIVQNEAKIALTKFLAAEPYIERVLLVNPHTDRVFDSNYGLERMSDSRNRPLLEHMRQNKAPRLQFYSYAAGDDGSGVIALLVPPGRRSADSGYLVVLLDREMFGRFLLRQNKQAGVEVFIANEQDRIILGESSQRDEWLAKKSVAEGVPGQGRYRIGLSTGNWSVNYSKMNSQPWTIHYMAQMNDWERKVGGLQAVTILVFLGFAAVLTLYLYWSLRSNVRPFSVIAAKLHPRTKGLDVRKEVDVIASSIASLEHHLSDLDYSLRSQREVVLEQSLRQWLLGGSPPAGFADDFKSEHMRVVVLRLEAYEPFKKMYSYGSRMLFKYAIRNIAGEVFAKHRIPVHSADMGGDHVALIAAEPEEGFAGTREAIERSLEAIAEWLKISCNASVSERAPLGQEVGMRRIYERVYEANLLKFIYGEQRLYLEADYERYLGTTRPADIDASLDKVVRTARLGDWPKSDVYLRELVDAISRLAYPDVELQLALILYRLNREFELIDESGLDSISQFLKRFSTLREVKEWLSGKLREAMADGGDGAQTGASRRDEIVGKVTDFIQSQLHDPTLNVERIADYMSYSSRHIRQVFKEMMHTTLTDYILNERLKRVKSLLLESELTIAEIAGRAGFLTKSHFYTAFKKDTNLTPAEFRKLYRQSIAEK